MAKICVRKKEWTPWWCGCHLCTERRHPIKNAPDRAMSIYWLLLINHREKTMSWPCFPCFPAHQEPPVNKRHSARLETAKSNSFNQSAREKNAWNKSTSYPHKRHRRFLNATSTLNCSKLDNHHSNASDVFFKITGSCGQTPLLNTFFFVLNVAAFDDDSHLQDHSEDEFEHVWLFDFRRHPNEVPINVQWASLLDGQINFDATHNAAYQSVLPQWLIKEDSAVATQRLISLLEIYVVFRYSRVGSLPLSDSNGSSLLSVITCWFYNFQKGFSAHFQMCQNSLILWQHSIDEGRDWLRCWEWIIAAVSAFCRQ